MPVTVTIDGDIAVVSVDNPPVNALSKAVRAGLANAVATLEANGDVRAVVLACAGKTFIAGADVKEFGRPPEPPMLPAVIDAIERASKPWVAAIHGTALGGGLEVALGCRFRIAAKGARLGLPEVMLGIIPGAGGTVRLPRLIATEAAVEMVTTGRHVPASEAEASGLIDAVIEGDLVAGATAFARAALERPLPPATRDRPVARPQQPSFWTETQQAISRQAKGVLAPVRALASLKAATESSFSDALANERAIFLSLRDSDQARGMRHAFFAERAVGKIDAIRDVAPRRIEKTAVVGAGTMGAGIATALVLSGLEVILIDSNAAALQRGAERVAGNVQSAVKRGRLGADEAATRLERLTLRAPDDADLGSVDLAIEAVFEEMGVKASVLAMLDKGLPAGAILATNTSYLDLDALAAGTSRPTDVIGLHFFNPAHIMRLVEIVEGKATAPDVLATGFALARRLGKIGVRSGVCDGFIGNRILKAYREQAERLLLEGAMPDQIDAAMRAFGMPMGPFEAQDAGGLDPSWAWRKAARAEGKTIFAPIADRLCELGRFGQKSGRGWYCYDEGSRTPRNDPLVADIAKALASELKIKPTTSDSAAIQARIVYGMIDEGARILDEGIARRPIDIDMIEVHGYGFPRWRGGLMFHADTIGLNTVVSALAEMAGRGLTRPPSALITRLAYTRGGFASLNT